MAGSEFSAAENAVIKSEFALLQEMARGRCSREVELEMIDKAFVLAQKVHDGVRSRNGQPHILHCIGVAKIAVQEIGLGYKSICAALLHDIFDDSDYIPSDLTEIFGEKITTLVIGLSQIKTVLDNEDSRKGDCSDREDDFRDILLTLGSDVRVILIKLADRLHNCRNLEFIPEYKRAKVLAETMNVFIPLSHKLGLYSIKSEMENIWLRYRQPQDYEEITRKVEAITSCSEGLMRDFLHPIRESLDKAGIEYEIKERVKSPYSIWYKIQHKGVTFEQICDLFAVRIIFKPGRDDIEEERNECFRIFSLITAIYRYRPERVRNWLTSPKQNGYEALHLTCLTCDDTSIEVQIRSRRMDDIAEKGISAHWNYKRLHPLEEESPIDKWLSGVRTVLENADIHSIDQLDMATGQHQVPQIFIFDENDNIHTLEKGSTARDFARSLGEDVSSKALAAKINHRLCLLDQMLSSADKVEIITSISR